MATRHQWGIHGMSFMGFFPSAREQALARDEAAHALEKYGAQAATVLLMKAQQTRSPERRCVYRLARRIVLRDTA
jgi:hypothetical protein